jgi:hypothetical protein
MMVPGMREKFLSSMRTIWESGTRRSRRAPIGLTPFEQAQRSWATSIGFYQDVPVAYRGFFEPAN